jgi:hypothetical protein
MTSALRGGWHDYIFPGVIGLLAVGFLVKAYGFSAASGAIPVLIGWTTVVLASADVAARIFSPDRQTPAAATGQAASMARVLIAVAGIVALTAVMALAGILRAVPVFLFVALRWGAGRKVTLSLLLAMAVTALLWAVFSRLLRLDIYPGLLFDAAG